MAQPLHPSTAHPSWTCRGSTQRCPPWSGAHIPSPPVFVLSKKPSMVRVGSGGTVPSTKASSGSRCRPCLRAVRDDPQRSPGFRSHPQLQLLTPMGCRDLLRSRTKLGHKDLSRFKDAPAHTQVGSAGGFVPSAPALGYCSDPITPPWLLPLPRTLLTFLARSCLPWEGTASVPCLAPAGHKPWSPTWLWGQCPSPCLRLPQGYQPSPSPWALIPSGFPREGRSVVWRDGWGYPRAPCQRLVGHGKGRGAGAVYRARSRFHGPCGGICLPASRATHGL